MILIVTFHSRWTVTMIKTNKLQLLRQFWPFYLNGVLANIISKTSYTFYIQSLPTLVEIPLGGPQQVSLKGKGVDFPDNHCIKTGADQQGDKQKNNRKPL